MSENVALNKIFESIFSRARQLGLGTFSTLEEKAKLLGIDKPSLSRYGSGSRDITRKRAERIAVNVAKELQLSEEEARDLANQLEGARLPQTDTQIKVQRWFAEHASPGWLMLVEFREPPMARRRNVVETIARAVASGMSYGMLYPFKVGEAQAARLPQPVRRYLEDVRSELIGLYQLILNAAFEETIDHSTAVSRADQRAELIEVTKRLRLYQLKEPGASACPAIGYRLFFVAHQDRTDQVERWEWISTSDGDQMIKKDASVLELRATWTRYFPIVEYWHRRKNLPQTTEDLTTFAAQRELSIHKQRFELNGTHWEVFESHAAEDLVDRFLEDRPPPTS